MRAKPIAAILIVALLIAAIQPVTAITFDEEEGGSAEVLDYGGAVLWKDATYDGNGHIELSACVECLDFYPGHCKLQGSMWIEYYEPVGRQTNFYVSWSWYWSCSIDDEESAGDWVVAAVCKVDDLTAGTSQTFSGDNWYASSKLLGPDLSASASFTESFPIELVKGHTYRFSMIWRLYVDAGVGDPRVGTTTGGYLKATWGYIAIPTAGGCPTLFAWNGHEFVEEGVLNIHSETGTDVVVKHELSTELKPREGELLLKLAEVAEGYNFSHSSIDYVELIAVYENGTEYACKLVSATHSRYGDVSELVSASDDVRVDLLKENGQVDELVLNFEKPPRFGRVIKFIFVIEGNNPVKL